MSNPLPEHIKALGPDQVRLMMQTGRLAPAFFPAAELWLAEKAQDSERDRDAVVSQQTAAASRAAAAAERQAVAAERAAAAAEKANRKANIAMLIATASIIATAIEAIVTRLHPG